MANCLRSIAALLTVLSVERPASAGSWVRGYVRHNGTYVSPHYRKSPGLGASYSPYHPPSFNSYGGTGPHGERSSAARSAFKREHPCPATGKAGGACPGYAIDHVNPLKRGGADAPWNMQWQTTESAKQKDKWE
jgi:hypothetical protein